MTKPDGEPWGNIPHKKGGHYCEGTSETAQAGSAVDYCYEEDTDKEGVGPFWAGNSEYESQVNYCPFCGAKGGEDET